MVGVHLHHLHCLATGCVPHNDAAAAIAVHPAVFVVAGETAPGLLLAELLLAELLPAGQLPAELLPAGLLLLALLPLEHV